MKYELYIFVCVFLIILIWNYWTQKRVYRSNVTEVIQTLMRQAGRYGVAAEQDENILIRVLHAYYAAGYTLAVKDIATADEIEAVTGIDFKEWERKVQGIQDEATKMWVEKCPQIAPPRSILTQVSGE